MTTTLVVIGICVVFGLMWQWGHHRWPFKGGDNLPSDGTTNVGGKLIP